MAHPLAGAYARIDRADRHFKELETILKRFRQAKDDEFFANRDHTTMEIDRSLKMFSRAQGVKLRSVPLDAAVVVGDVINNLRSSLDYLIYELACEDTPGVEHNGTQFVIANSKADTKGKLGRVKQGFDFLSKKRLGGLNQRHIGMIEQLQPYKGVAWTETLREISNPDKHRKLTAIGGELDAASVIEGGDPGSFKGRPGKVFSGIGVNGADVYVERHHAIQVQLPNGTPVLETLEILKRNVRATIDAFKPEFK